jgi:amidase
MPTFLNDNQLANSPSFRLKICLRRKVLPAFIFRAIFLALLQQLRAMMSTGTHPIGEQMPKLAQVTLEDLSTGLDARRFTSYQLVQTYKRRIAQVNNNFNVVLEINPEVEKIAKQLDEERQQGHIRG